MNSFNEVSAHLIGFAENEVSALFGRGADAQITTTRYTITAMDICAGDKFNT